jgi:2-polyprenyl-3-methyl-5-hydroxy-6-metoxy-1,4-benzoquinol methylase
MSTPTTRSEREIAHGQYLARGDTEEIWGWGTPAGRLRARRRGGLIARGAGLGPGVSALEIGCGTGMFTAMFAETGARLLAADISPDLIEKARARNLASDRVRFLECRFEEATVSGPFDAVIGSSVLHHLDVPRALVRIHGLLGPGGRLCLAEPNMLNPQVFVERRFRRWFPYVSPDETAFVRWRLAEQLRAAGFMRITLVPFDWLHPATPPWLIPVVRRLGLCLEFLPGVREFAGSLLISAARGAEHQAPGRT